jgi:hypothetical protein
MDVHREEFLKRHDQRNPNPPRTDCGVCGHDGEHALVDCTDNLKQDIIKLRRGIYLWITGWRHAPDDLRQQFFSPFSIAERISQKAWEDTNVVPDVEWDDHDPLQMHTIPTPTND